MSYHCDDDDAIITVTIIIIILFLSLWSLHVNGIKASFYPTFILVYSIFCGHLLQSNCFFAVKYFILFFHVCSFFCFLCLKDFSFHVVWRAEVSRMVTSLPSSSEIVLCLSLTSGDLDSYPFSNTHCDPLNKSLGLFEHQFPRSVE